MAELTQNNAVPLKTFLETVPPGKLTYVSNYLKKNNPHTYLATPDLYLYCETEGCSGYRYFSSETEGPYLSAGKPNNEYLTYFCKNCGEYFKTFSLIISINADGSNARFYKYGELPEFGPPIPAKTIKLVGPDKDLFLMGRRAERQGMGIGAFTYYRRVIESQKNRIFDEIIRVLSKVAPADSVIEEIRIAKNEIQFTKAIDSIRHGLPQSLQINGYNPLALLHSALSKGVHELSDDECLGLATSIRTILIELSDRLSQALKDDAELNSAINLLAKRKQI